MKTTINIDDILLREAMRLYGIKTKTRIIELGLEELIKAHKRSLLAATLAAVATA